MKLMMLAVLVLIQLPLEAQEKKRANVSWQHLQIASGLQAPGELDASELGKNKSANLKYRKPANNSFNQKPHLHGDLNVYASCIDGQGLIYQSGSAAYDNCLGQTTGGRQVFVQDASRGLLFMLDISRYHTAY